MSTQRMTLSFLTESKASHVGITSMRRVAITLLVMLLATASAWAQLFPTYYHIYFNPNYPEGMGIAMVDVPVSTPTTTYTLASYDEPTREGYAFRGWSTSSTGPIQYRTNDKITLTGNLTLYAIWGKVYDLTLNPNYDGGYDGGMDKTIAVSVLNPTYTLTSADVPSNEGYTFLGWSTTPTGDVEYETENTVTLTGNLTLYAIWDDTPLFKWIYDITNENLRQVKLSGYEGELLSVIKIPATVIIEGTAYSVTSIGNFAFDGCKKLKSITIPTSVTSIGDQAFGGCWNLTSVTIPNSVTSIGDGVFKDCTRLESVTIPNSVTSIGYYAFWGCINLISVTIPNSVTSIGDCAFEGCSSLQSVTIPNSVTSIGNSAFRDCNNLQSVTIPNSVTSIGKETFRKCKSLTSVTIPNSVTSIGNSAFRECESLQSVTINGNPKIGTDAFWGVLANVTMNLTASQISNDYWTTFYNNGYNFQTDGNTTVYKGTVDGSSLVLTEVSDRIVNKKTAVILKSSGNPVMTLTETYSSDTNGNDLRGFSERFSRTSVISDFNANEIYTMGNTSAGFGFHKYTGEFVPAGKAFLPLNIENGAKPILNMVFANETTGITPLSSDDNALQNDWFSLDGTRLNGKPTQRGIYINGNKKVVVR